MIKNYKEISRINGADRVYATRFLEKQVCVGLEKYKERYLSLTLCNVDDAISLSDGYIISTPTGNSGNLDDIQDSLDLRLRLTPRLSSTSTIFGEKLDDS